MQDRYTGDVGDFGKLGLLRMLCGQDDAPPLKLGVVWYVVPDELHNEDGKHIKYLNGSSQFRACDPALYDGLRELIVDAHGKVNADRRRVAILESSTLLPPGTVFFSDPLRFHGTNRSEERLSVRNEWVTLALRATPHADMIFVDPDNGIECRSVSRTAKTGPKYIFWDEIRAFADRGQSVVVYHHLNRVCSSAEQVGRLRVQFTDRMPPEVSTLDVVFKRGTRRAYFIVAAPGHRDALAKRLSEMLKTSWGSHFIRTV